MSACDDFGSFRPTRFTALGYRKDAPGLWRFVCTETRASIGPQYSTRAELLADLENYARDAWGLS